MAKIVDVATIHFQIPDTRGSDPARARREALAQTRASFERLEGTGTDLVVTCEGVEAVVQSLDEAESPDRPGELLSLYADFARRNACVVAGSAKLPENGKIYNALIFYGPQGEVLGSYRKTFCTKGELDGHAAGPGAVVVDTPAGRLGGVICFDLNFGELRQAYAALRPDILVFSSMFHGGLMQPFWALECRCFFASACKDNSSDVYDPFGRRLALANYHTRIARARINLDRILLHQDGNMEKYRAIHAKYGKEILLDVAPDLGLCLLFSTVPTRTAADIVREFDLLPYDGYLAQSRALNEKSRA